MKILARKGGYYGYRLAYVSKKNIKRYYKQFVFENSLAELADLFNKKISYAVTTDCFIKPKGVSFGIGPIQALLIKGWPNAILAKKHGAVAHRVYVYKSRTNKHTVFTNLHFINNRLSYVHLCFPRRNTPIEEIIFSILKERYKCEIPRRQDFVIRDNFNNKILILSEVDLSIYYLPGDSAFAQVIKDELYKTQFLKQQSVQRQQEVLEDLL